MANHSRFFFLVDNVKIVLVIRDPVFPLDSQEAQNPLYPFAYDLSLLETGRERGATEIRLVKGHARNQSDRRNRRKQTRFSAAARQAQTRPGYARGKCPDYELTLKIRQGIQLPFTVPDG